MFRLLILLPCRHQNPSLSFLFLFSIFFFPFFPFFLFLFFFVVVVVVVVVLSFPFLTERRNCLFVHERALKSIGLIRDAQQFPTRRTRA